MLVSYAGIHDNFDANIPCWNSMLIFYHDIPCWKPMLIFYGDIPRLYPMPVSHADILCCYFMLIPLCRYLILISYAGIPCWYHMLVFPMLISHASIPCWYPMVISHLYLPNPYHHFHNQRQPLYSLIQSVNIFITMLMIACSMALVLA